MPLLETRGAASAKGFGLTATTVQPVYIEDVFSTYLYTGDSTYRAIINDINLADFGGAVIVKGRSSGTQTYDTDNIINPAGGFSLSMDNQNARQQNFNFAGFNSNGFVVWSPGPFGFANTNTNGTTYTSWTFRKQPKFFDVVGYTGDGSPNRQISHNLGSTPGFIIIKKWSNTQSWVCYHRSAGTGKFFILNGTDGLNNDANAFPSVTSTTFTPTADTNNFGFNDSGDSYVAYLFAHDAGGFGLSGTDNVISCGSYTDTGSGVQTVTLGWEPQWVLRKRSNSADNWTVVDNMRGLGDYGNAAGLNLNTTGAEFNFSSAGVTSTGFQWATSGSANTFIYVAIRRGPMKTPTTGTSVFSPLANNNSTGTKNTTNFPVDMQINTIKEGDNRYVVDRLRGISTNSTAQPYELRTNDTAAENASNNRSLFWDNTGFQTIAYYGSATFYTAVYYNFRRAPGFFDVVCYTGTGAGQTVNHNLGVIPELIILKNRSSASTDWPVKCPVGLTDTGVVYLNLDLSNATGVWQTGDTSTTFKTRSVSNLFYNQSGQTYVAYLFATVAGVSKVGSYTGTGTTLQINCGFTGGARFVLIKRTDDTGDWYVWDSARGIVAGNDPYLLLNSTAAEVTNTDYVDTFSSGFEISSTAPAAINANGGTFIYLAIA